MTPLVTSDARPPIPLGEPGRPALVAHRGFSSRAPENTIAAFHYALESGAQHIECDVHLSIDGVPVVIHDETLARTTGAAGLVCDYSVHELKRLSAGAWFSRLYLYETIPTLAEALEWIGDDATLLIELKSSSRNRDKVPPALVEAVVRDIRLARAEGRTALLSFDLAALREARRLAPDLPTGALFESPGLSDRTPEAVAAGATYYVANVESYARETAAAAIAAGLRPYVYTVDRETDFDRLRDMGISGIATNRFEELLRHAGTARIALRPGAPRDHARIERKGRR